MSTTCVIGARGGSKGVANKNIRPMLGKPLIAWSIEQALAALQTHSTRIEGVVSEQLRATNLISERTGNAAHTCENVNAELDHVTRMISMTEKAAGDVLQKAKLLAHESLQLSHDARQFINEVRAA